MGLAITCACGATIPVTTSMCGSTITCACGRANVVPSLRALRLAAPGPQVAGPPVAEGAMPGTRNVSPHPVAGRKPARCWLRTLAYLFDMTPILLGTLLVFFMYFGFDRTLRAYRERDDLETGMRFRIERNRIGNTSLLIYLIYAAVCEGSPLCGTIGKRCLGMSVVDERGGPISMDRATVRNLVKILSALPCGLGFLWALWSPDKRAWHDYIARTYVVLDERR